MFSILPKVSNIFREIQKDITFLIQEQKSNAKELQADWKKKKLPEMWPKLESNVNVSEKMRQAGDSNMECLNFD